MAANVWFGPGPLTAKEQRLCIRKYTRFLYSGDRDINAEAIYTKLQTEKPRALAGGYKAKAILQITRELKRAREGKPFMTRFKRNRKSTVLTAVMRARINHVYKGEFVSLFLFVGSNQDRTREVRWCHHQPVQRDSNSHQGPC